MRREGPDPAVADRRAHFDELASRWDTLRPVGAQDQVVERGLDLVGPLEGRTVVDLGSGTGLLEGHLLGRIGRGRILAIDSSPQMVARARAKHPDGRIQWICRDVLDADIGDASADVVLCYNTWPHFDQPERVAGAFLRWLRPTGRALVWHDIGRERLAVLHADAGGAIAGDRLPPLEDLAALFMEAGFAVLQAAEDADSYTCLVERRGAAGESGA